MISFIKNSSYNFKWLYIFIFAFCSIKFVYCESFELPSFNPDLLTFFTSESRFALLQTMEEPFDIFQFGSGGFFDDIHGQKVLQATTGFIFPLNEHVAIPIHFSALSNSSRITYFPMIWPVEPTYHELFTGTGLILNTNWFTLGSFLGYHRLTISNALVNEESHGINFAIVPIITPNLWYLKRIESYFSTGQFNQRGDSNKNESFDFKDIQFYARFVIDGFTLFNQSNNQIEPFYSRGNYDWITKNTIYGIRFGINRFSIESGYRIFDDNFNNTFFISSYWQFPSPSFVMGIFSNERCFVSFSIDRHYKKFGIGVADVLSQIGGNGISLLELVLNHQNKISLSFTQKIIINWSIAWYNF
jgi:hypothetical protein